MSDYEDANDDPNEPSSALGTEVFVRPRTEMASSSQLMRWTSGHQLQRSPKRMSLSSRRSYNANGSVHRQQQRRAMATVAQVRHPDALGATAQTTLARADATTVPLVFLNILK
jgi:hypothetical protein